MNPNDDVPDDVRRAWEAEDRAWNKMCGLGLTPEERLTKRIEHLEKRLNEVEGKHYVFRQELEGRILQTFGLLCFWLCFFAGVFFLIKWLWSYAVPH